jgi:hypothetical protein
MEEADLFARWNSTYDRIHDYRVVLARGEFVQEIRYRYCVRLDKPGNFSMTGSCNDDVGKG